MTHAVHRLLNGPLIAVAWDAAEPSLVETWMEAGVLPNLRRLREEGGYRRLASSAELLAGCPWPTFYTGTPPETHGIYHFLQWRAESMSNARPDPAWLPAGPFWHDLGSAGRRSLVIDVPMAPPPVPFNGVEISGWSSHDRLAPPQSFPEDVFQSVVREFGDCPLGDEIFGCPNVRYALRIRDEVLESTRRLAELTASWLRRDAWDFLLVAFGATHRGGHRLWDSSGIRGAPRVETSAAIATALKEIYAACDDALGKIRDAAPPGSTLVVFSLHGMGPNTSRVELLPGMLARVLSGQKQPSSSAWVGRSVQSVLNRFPVEWRHEVKKRLPVALKDWLTETWFTGGGDRSTQQAFSLVADLQGYIRINLRGRETCGVVEPGDEFERLCDRIEAGLSSFADADTGERVVEAVVRTGRRCRDGERLDRLPDLIVTWHPSASARHRAVVSAEFGAMPWPTPGKQPDGRSGNHRFEGFVAGLGDAIAGGHILDLAPSFMTYLGVPPRASMKGRRLATHDIVG